MVTGCQVTRLPVSAGNPATRQPGNSLPQYLHARQARAADEFERCAAARRNVRDLAREAARFHCLDRLAAADDADTWRLGYGARHRNRALRQRFFLECP